MLDEAGSRVHIASRQRAEVAPAAGPAAAAGAGVAASGGACGELRDVQEALLEAVRDDHFEEAGVFCPQSAWCYT